MKLHPCWTENRVGSLITEDLQIFESQSPIRGYKVSKSDHCDECGGEEHQSKMVDGRQRQLGKIYEVKVNGEKRNLCEYCIFKMKQEGGL